MLRGLLRRVAPPAGAVAARDGREDELSRELAQGLVRLVLGISVLVYLIVSYYPIDVSAGYPPWLVFLTAFIGSAVLVLALALRYRTPSATRRTIMVVVDVFAVSFVMVTTGEVGIPLFIVYLSVTLGNGLRFGARAMTLSAVLSLAGFSLVIALSPVWAKLWAIAVPIMIVLALLPFSHYLSPGIVTKPKGTAPVEPIELRQRLNILLAPFRPKRLDELGREQGQAGVRLANSLFVFAYLLIALYPVDFESGYPTWLLFAFGFVAFSISLLVLALRATASSVVRRVVGNIGDACAISYVMIATGATGIPLFILYLSTTLGNGFRFGLRALMASAALCLAAFSVVVALSPTWQALPVAVPIAVALALVMLPLYTAHLIDQLAQATRRAEEASAAKSRFLARMSHELRTPLNGIWGTTELLSNSKRLTRDDRSLLGVIRDSVKVSMRQIDNVLDFSKIEAGKLTIEQVGFDLHALLNRAIRLVRATALEKNLRLTLRIDPAVPYRLIGDPHQLHEVLLNLLSNAIKFTEKGYVSLEAHLIDADTSAARIRFEVHDTGIGIEPTALARIFEAFTQEDGGTTRRYGGTGLGTTIAKQLVELMGGELRVESIKGKGSRFHASMRFARRSVTGERPDITLNGLRVLLVTPDAGLMAHFESAVRDWAVCLGSASSIGEAVGILARSIRMGDPASAILLDSRIAFDGSGDHQAADFLEKAWLSATPAFLISDVSPEEARLREWGYAAVLPQTAAGVPLHRALHSCRIDEAANDQGLVHVEPWAWRQPAGRTRPRLLIADDNRTNLMILQRILESAGYEVDTAENGESALDKMLHGRYKVAVVDMHMPGLDGVAVIKQYRMMHSGARMPVIMLTANATIDAKLESAEAGADAYLTKPATAAAVVSTIKKLLDDRQLHELRPDRLVRSAAAEVPVLDPEVISELGRLYDAPEELSRLLDTFEAEGGRTLQELQTTVTKRNHAAFRELIHALKGNGANVGALRLAKVCLEAENTSVIDFYREGRRMVSEVQEAFAQATRALRQHVATGSGPAQSDLQ